MLLVATLVAACSTSSRGTAVTPSSAPRNTSEYGEQAALRAIGGSAVFGKVRVIDRSDGATVLVSAINIPPGGFRIAFHENPNCTSPNGFSAGPAWAPAGKDPTELMPIQHVNSEGRAETEIRVAALHSIGVDGVAGRSVVMYAGSKVTDARPGVPNERIACGVFEPAHPLTF